MENTFSSTGKNEDNLVEISPAGTVGAFGSTAADSGDIATIMQTVGSNARAAAIQLETLGADVKNAALLAAASKLRARSDEVLQSNARDLERAAKNNMRDSLMDRLALDHGRIEAMAKALEDVADLDDPVGSVIDSWERGNGLKIQRVRSPLGVIGMIYESRPNVTTDASALCLKSGNAVILRSGSDSFHSSSALGNIMSSALREVGIHHGAIQHVPSMDRAAVGHILSGLDGCIDVVIPRGGRSLIERVRLEAKVPVFSHLDGNCHVYVHAAADLDKAIAIVANAKMRRTGICGAAETLLIDRAVAHSFLPAIGAALTELNCELRGDDEARAIFGGMNAATNDDWATEYHDAILAIRVVDGVDAAIDHVRHYGSSHTDAIITEDTSVAAKFMRGINSAIVMHNASTQFADGGEFGMGAEIGIATGRFHARGPIGVEQLTVMQYRVFGDGHCRPL